MPNKQKKRPKNIARSHLRHQAEKLLADEPAPAAELSAEEARHLIHELQVYQIELEMQNDDLRKSREELAALHERYLNLYELAPAGYLTIDPSKKIINANLTIITMLGVERGQLQGRLLSSLVIEHDQDILYRFVREAMGSADLTSCELRLKRIDQQPLWVKIDGRIQEGEEGSRLRLIVTDISQQKRLAAQLEQSRLQWERTFDAMDDLVTLQDKDRRIIRANKATYDFFQAGPDELQGSYCFTLFRGTGTPCAGCPMQETLSNGFTHHQAIRHKSLDKIYEVTFAQVQGEEGDEPLYVHIARDITEKTRLEEELFQSRKMEAIGTLAGGIAHDFNNILQIITGYAELIEENLSQGDLNLPDLQQIVFAVGRARDLVTQILSFSRKDMKTLQPLQPQLIIKEGLKLMRATLPTTIDIQQDIDPACGNIMSEPTRLHQILVNLCTNAIHAMAEEKGTLRVTLHKTVLTAADMETEMGIKPGPFVKLAISDTGCGMDADLQKHIFEPYFTTKKLGKGTGMGLAVVQGIVSNQGGVIRLASEPEKGTTVSIYFPELAPSRDQQAEKQQGETVTGGDERILVVDDDPLLVHASGRILESIGYQVTTITNSQAAYTLFAAAPENFDLVITDQTMPHLSGMELGCKLLALRPGLPIILCTGYSAVTDATKAIASGIKKFLMKPVKGETLTRCVRQVLDDSRSGVQGGKAG